MVNVDFNVLLEAFHKECEKAGFVAVAPIGTKPAAKTTTNKRPYNGGGSQNGGYAKKSRH